MENNFITQFSITNLFGYKNFSLTFENSIQIVIGENGYGKTTILNALYYVLKKDYEKLLRINFTDIEIIFKDDKKFSFSRELIRLYCQYLQQKKSNNNNGITQYIERNLLPEDFNKLQEFVQQGNKEEAFKIIKKNTQLQQLPPQIVYQEIFNLNEIRFRYKVFEDFDNYLCQRKLKVLYFPTFRRVEEELKNLFPSQPEKRAQMPIEQNDILRNDTIIKFGMQDVEKNISKIINNITQSSLTGFATVYGNMITQLLNSNTAMGSKSKFDINEIRIVLSRIGKSLTGETKEEIIHKIESGSEEFKNNNFLVYFLEQLLDVYKEQEKYDSAIKMFRDICNGYLSEKSFIYDESAVTLKIYRKMNDELLNDDGNKLELKQLSSGEKQIVSIFSQIYLDPDSDFIVLFDEPELSLSIYWQEKLLPDIISSGRCKFMFAVTHSPFIFNNDLKQYTIGLKEFMSNGNKN